MSQVNVWYDREGDFLEVVFEDAPAFLEEVGDGIFEHRTTDGQIVGFTVMNFSRHDRDDLQLPFSLTAAARDQLY